MDELLKKLIQGLACCLRETDEESEEMGCGRCPYKDGCDGAEQDIPVNYRIMNDIRAYLKEQKLRIMTPDEASTA